MIIQNNNIPFKLNYILLNINLFGSYPIRLKTINPHYVEYYEDHQHYPHYSCPHNNFVFAQSTKFNSYFIYVFMEFFNGEKSFKQVFLVYIHLFFNT